MAIVAPLLPVAAKRLGLETIPTTTVAGLTDAQKHLLRIADNKLGLACSWDPDLLNKTLIEIKRQDISIDLTLSGFSAGEIDVVSRAGCHPS